MSNSLGATIDQVQVAFDNGDYRSVVESCTHIIDQYPHYTAAQRLLGLAYLEQGQIGEAETWFARLLVHDPRDPSAYLGLGLIAEDRGVLDHALAYCQVAWELAPYDQQFREPVNRVAAKRYGVDGRLRLTHAALAQIHANASRLRRAIKEYQSALIALPDRIDLWMGLAATLWILGENDDAAEIAQEFLKDHSDLIPALVILADIEQRTGDSAQADEYRDRLRRLDPDSTITAAMIARQPLADSDFLLMKPEEQPVLAEWADTVVSERPQFAPAPDFTFQPEHDDAIEADIDDLQPIRLEEFSDEMPDIPLEPTTSSFIPESIDGEEEEPDTVEVEPVAADEFEQLDEMIEEASSPARGVPGATVATVAAINLLDMEFDDEPPPFSDEDVDEAELESLLDDFEGIEPMSLDDFGASDEGGFSGSSGFFEDSEIDFDIKIEDPDAVQIGGGPPAVTPGVFSSGGSLSETSGLGDDEFPELPEVDEPGNEPEIDEVDRATVILESGTDSDFAEPQAEATETAAAEQEPEVAEPAASPEPPAGQPAIVPSGTGFTRLLGELGNEGLAPFDPARTATATGDMSASGNENAAFPSLADGWDEIDAQLASATPGGDGADELLDIDELGLEPFTLDDEDMDLVTSVDPARKPVQPEPAADPFQEVDQVIEPESTHADTGSTADDDIAGIQPFAFEDFDEVDDEDSFEFGVLPWEQQEGAAGLDVQELLAEVTETDEPEEALETAEPSLDPELPTGADDYLNITAELTSGSLDPQFARRMAEVEEAARQNLDRLNRDQGREPSETVAAADVGMSAPDPEQPHTNVVTPTADHLVMDAGMFERSRAAKDELIQQGAIKGNREFATGAESAFPADVVEPAAREPEAPLPEQETTVIEPETIDQESEAADVVVEPADVPLETDADVDSLRIAVENNPRDDEARWQYAEALREQGEIHAAFTEYRWLIRHAPGRHNAIIASLELCAFHDQEADLAHRLLADIYRRRGDGAQARNHASMAMATRRLMREIKM